MKFQVKVNTSSSPWANIKNFLVKTNTYSWANVKTGWVKVSSGTWKKFWAGNAPTISQTVTLTSSQNSSTALYTLTGKNYLWSANLGETYAFERSVDSGATWQSLKTDVATDSSTYTYQLTDDIHGAGTGDVLPDVTNQYRFSVTAHGDAGSGVSTSDILYINGAETVTIDSHTPNPTTITIGWTSAPDANRYSIDYKKSTSSTWATYAYTSNNSVVVGAISGKALVSNTSYDFRILSWTGTTNGTGYTSYYSDTATFQTSPPLDPVQTNAPIISGSGYAFTDINGTAGTYTSGTYLSKSVSIRATTDSTPPTNGSTSPLPLIGAPPYTVKQVDASSPSFIFYYTDEVVDTGGNTRYYYSSGIKAKVGQLTDDFTRSVSSGLGYMTPAWNTTVSPNSYYYDITSNSWSVSGGNAVGQSSVSGTNPYGYTTAAVELGGKTNITSKVQFPGNFYGLGLMYWATNAGSWWASTAYRTTQTATKYTYYLMGTSCTVETTPDSSYCASAIVQENVCTEDAGTFSNHCAIVTKCPQNGIGDQITHCATHTSTICPANNTGTSSVNCNIRFSSTCPSNGTGDSIVNCGIRTIVTCPDNATGTSGSNCKARTVATCTDNNLGSSGSNCKSRTVYTCPANGTGNNIVNCGIRTVGTCPANATGSSSYYCNVRTGYSCPNNNGGSTSNNCKTRTSTTYTCKTGYSYIGSGLCQGNSYPYPTISATPVNTTLYDSYTTYAIYDSPGTTTAYDSLQSGTAYDAAGTGTVYDSSGSSTVYDSTVTTTYYDSSATETVYDGPVDHYSGYVMTDVTKYYTTGYTDGPYTTLDTLPPSGSQYTSTSVTAYNTKIKISSADGSTVNTMADSSIELSDTPSQVWGMQVQTSNNSITTTLFNNSSLTIPIGSFTYNATSPNKSRPNGWSAAGFIQIPGYNGYQGLYFDNLSIV